MSQKKASFTKKQRPLAKIVKKLTRMPLKSGKLQENTLFSKTA